MSLIRIDRNPPPRQLRIFGLIWLLVFGFLGYMAFRKSGLTLPVRALWTMAAAIPAVGFVFLPVLRWAYLGLSYATFPIGWVISHLTLALVYFGVITPIGIVMRLGGRDPMARRFDRSATTYWHKRRPKENPERYFRQF
jgi:hypothetical protein